MSALVEFNKLCKKYPNVKFNLKGQIKIEDNVVIEDYVEIIVKENSLLEIKENCTIKKFSHINCLNGSTVILGRYVHIGMFNLINGTADILIDDYTIIGPYVLINSVKHNFENLEKPIRFQEVTSKRIIIGEDCWIGQGAIIMDKIGKKTVIGAGSIVTKEIPSYSVAYGIPCKVVKRRKQ